MRRLVGIAWIAALAAALSFGVAGAAFAPPAASSLDLRSQLNLRLFGETGDSGATLAAAYGDRSSESPLRGLALGAGSGPGPGGEFTPNVAWVPTFAALAAGERNAAILTDASFGPYLQPAAARYAPPARAGDAVAAAAENPPTAVAPSAAVTVAAYQPEAAAATAGAPEPGAIPFGLSAALSTAGAPAGTQRSNVFVPGTLHVGPAQFQGRVESESVQTPELKLDDNAYGAGADWVVRAGGRNVNVDVSSSYEHLARNDATTASASALGTGSTWQLPGDDVPLAVPNYADMNKVAVGAAVAVPVFKGLTLNLNYDAARMLGAYGLPGVTNVDAFDNSYGGGLTLNIPRFSSTLSLSARQLHNFDNILPSNSSTTTRADVNLTVKF